VTGAGFELVPVLLVARTRRKLREDGAFRKRIGRKKAKKTDRYEGCWKPCSGKH